MSDLIAPHGGLTEPVDRNVPAAEAADFKAKLAATPRVPVSDADAPWIEELYHRQITAGCNANPLLYCPDRTNTRAQMAVFLVKDWGLRLY